MTRIVTDWELRWKRRDREEQIKVFRSLKTLRRRIGVMTSPTPWRFYGSDVIAGRSNTELTGDELVCCDGSPERECGCGGATVREQAEQRRADLQPLEYIRARKRQRTVTTTPWESVETSWPVAAEIIGAVIAAETEP